MMFPLRPEHQLTAPPVKLVRTLKTFMRVSGREYHRANSMIIQPAVRTSTLYLRNHPKGNIIEALDDDVLSRSGSPTQHRSSKKADLTSRFFYVWILVYSADARCRVISSGQGHQLSTGTVKSRLHQSAFLRLKTVVSCLLSRQFTLVLIRRKILTSIVGCSIPVRATNSAPEQ